MKIKIQIFSLLFLLTPDAIFSQVRFVKAFGGTSAELPQSIIQTNGNGYVIAGNTASFGAGGIDVFVVKFDGLGIPLWVKTVGGSLIDGASSIVQVLDGGFLIAGGTNSFGAGDTDAFIIKMDGSGNLEWARTLGGSGIDIARCVTQDYDNGYLVVGETRSFGGQDADIFVAKFDTLGNHLWCRIIGGTGDDYGKWIIRTQDGGYAISGYSSSSGAGGLDLVLIKFDSQWNLEWSITAGGSDDEENCAVVQASDGGYGIGGYTLSFGSGIWDYFIVKVSSQGSYEWSKTAGGTSYERAFTMTYTQDGGYLLGGYTFNYGAGTAAFFLVKFDETGSYEWANALGLGGYERGYSVIQTSDGGYLLTGFTQTVGAGDWDLLLAKYDENGNSCEGEMVSPDISSPSTQVAPATFNISNVSPVITLPSPSVTSPSPLLTVVCEYVDIKENRDVFAQVADYNYFFKDKIKVCFSSPSTNRLKVILMDITGKVFYSRGYRYTPYKLEVKGEKIKNLKPGIYFLRLYQGNVLLKTLRLIKLNNF